MENFISIFQAWPFIKCFTFHKSRKSDIMASSKRERSHDFYYTWKKLGQL